jgi:hypothetical protein
MAVIGVFICYWPTRIDVLYFLQILSLLNCYIFSQNPLLNMTML